MENFGKGIENFNEGHFFEAHEEWEKVWRALGQSPEKLFVQGMIKVAAALHHYKEKEFAGTFRLLERGMEILSENREADIGIDREDFLKQVMLFYEKIRDGDKDSTLYAPPRIKTAG